MRSAPRINSVFPGQPQAQRETRKRIPLYLGPKDSVARDSLEPYERAGSYVADEKHDGFWSVVSVVDGTIAAITSRVGLELEAPGLVGLPLRGGGNGKLVGELTADLVGDERSGTRRLRLFDIVEWNALDLRDLTQAKRRAALEMVHDSAVGASELVTLTEYVTQGFTAFYDRVVGRGGEGIVLKRHDQKYRGAGSDGKIPGWVRCKPARTVDYVIMSHGLSKGGSPNLQLGLITKGKLTFIIDVAVPMFLRRASLDSLVGKVAECVGAEMWPSGALRHARIQRLRDDKATDECTLAAALRVR
jgi:hypothetical protein